MYFILYPFLFELGLSGCSDKYLEEYNMFPLGIQKQQGALSTGIIVH